MPSPSSPPAAGCLRFQGTRRRDRARPRELERLFAPVLEVADGPLPRVLQLGEAPELAELLLRLEEAEREWAIGVRLIHEVWDFPNELAWERAAATCAPAARLYEHLVSQGTGRWHLTGHSVLSRSHWV